MFRICTSYHNFPLPVYTAFQGNSVPLEASKAYLFIQEQTDYALSVSVKRVRPRVTGTREQDRSDRNDRREEGDKGREEGGEEGGPRAQARGARSQERGEEGRAREEARGARSPQGRESEGEGREEGAQGVTRACDHHNRPEVTDMHMKENKPESKHEREEKRKEKKAEREARHNARNGPQTQ